MVLYSFGQVTESYYGMHFGMKGILYYGLLYIGGTALSTLPSYGKHKDDYSYTAVGASGAVSAVLFASIVFVPLGKIMIFPIPIGIPAIIFGPLFLIYSAYMNKKNIDNVGHDAHFWGAIFGFVFTIVLKPVLIVDLYTTLMNIF
jgi:membrane associated rhomboid family serine protease